MQVICAFLSWNLFNFFTCKSFFAVAKFTVAKSSVFCFHFPKLIIVWISSPVIFVNGKWLHKIIVCYHTIRIQISKVKFTSLFLFQTNRTRSIGRICLHPAMWRYIKLCPVMSSAEIRFCSQSALPACRNPCAAT